MIGIGIGLRIGANVVQRAPSLVAGVSGFWRADSGASPATWANRKATGDLAQATGAKRPTIVASGLSGQPIVRFNGSSHVMGIRNAAHCPSISFFRASSTGPM